MRLSTSDRLAVLLHDGILGTQGKTGLALLRYSAAQPVAVIDRQTAGQNLQALTGIAASAPIVDSVQAALVHQPTVLAIGIAPSGGALPPEWRQEIRTAIAAGLSILNGLHTPLATDPEFQGLLQPGQQIWDVRQEPPGLRTGTGQARSLPCRRVLAVGTDMGVGKMSTMLELYRQAQKRGLRSKFVATGQAGLMIAGEGVALDAVRVDFAAGAVEQAVLQAAPDQDILWVEGQGSLLHPASTATLPLMRGAQPTHLLLVHRAGQDHLRNFPDLLIPPLPEVVPLYESLAAGAGLFGHPRVAAIALNTAHLDEPAAQLAIAVVRAKTGLPCTDPVRFDADELLDAFLQG